MRTHRFALLLMIACGSMTLLHSCSSRHFWKGVRAFDETRYQDATKSLQLAVTQWPNDTMAWRLLGNTQLLLSDFDAAEKTYQELDLRSVLTDQDRINWASALMNQGRYAESAEILESVIISDQPGVYAEALWNKCEQQLHIEADPRFWQTSIFEIPEIAVAAAPRMSQGFVYFSTEPYEWGSTESVSRLDLNEMYIIDLAQRDRRVMRTSQLDAWDVPAHDGFVSLSPDGRSIAFSRKGKDGMGWFGDPQTGGHTLFVSKRTASGRWSEPRSFPFVEKGYTFAHPTWSLDGSKLYFSTDIPSPESQGGMDLWYSERNGTFWSDPINLGPKINTPGDEVFPSFTEDGSLYFSSNGHPSFGGLDIYCSQLDTENRATHWREGEVWMQPQHLAFPINTMTDDYSLVLEPGNRKGFVCSNRSGIDQIYRIDLVESPAIYDVVTVSNKTGKWIPRAHITLIDIEDASAITVVTGLDGSLRLPLPPGRIYRMESRMPGHIIDRRIVSSDDLGEQEEIVLSEIGQLRDYRFAQTLMGGKPFELAGTNWRENQMLLKAKAQFDLVDLADFLKLNSQILLEIRTYEDASSYQVSADDKTVKTSKSRAIEIESFLMRHGVSSKQLIAVGLGSKNLRNDCEPGSPCSIVSHQENRRTEYRIYGLIQRIPGQIDPIPFTKNWEDKKAGERLD